MNRSSKSPTCRHCGMDGHNKSICPTRGQPAVRCSENGCDGPIFSRARCNPHYQLWYTKTHRPPSLQATWTFERRKDKALRDAHGISLVDYERMLSEQHGKCAICGGPSGKRNFHVDHDHRTGVVRSLLCSKCNQALGLLREDPVIIDALLAYVIAWRARGAA